MNGLTVAGRGRLSRMNRPPGRASGTPRTCRATAAAWRRILRAVTSYADLEPELLGRVEELIDFVTAAESE